jgi:Ca2+-binding RTX toxin-like protein
MSTVFNARDYGALGDGVTDDTQAIQAAIDAAAVTGGEVYLPEGTYIVSSHLQADASSCLYLRSGVTLAGDGAGATTLRLADGSGTVVSGIVQTVYNTQNVGAHDLTIDGNRANTTGQVDGFTTGAGPAGGSIDLGVTLDNVALINCSGNGLNAQESTTRLSVTDSVARGNGLDGFFAHLVHRDGFYIDGRGFQDNLSEDNGRNGFSLLLDRYRTSLADNDSANNGGSGILVQGPPKGTNERADINGGEVYGNGDDGVLLKMVDLSQTRGVTVHDNGGAAVRLIGTSSNTVADNTLYDNVQDHGNAEVVIQAQDDEDVTATERSSGNVIYHNIISGSNATYGVAERNEDVIRGNQVSVNYFSGVGEPATLLYGIRSDAFGNHAGVVQVGTARSDVLTATLIADTLLYGGNGDDHLTGGNRDDLLYGGVGRDRLNGGDGADIFRYTASSHSVRGASDLISGFVPGEDQLDVAILGYSGLGDGHDGTLRVSYSTALDRTYLRSLDADSGGEYFQVALAGNYVGQLSASDFQLLRQGTLGEDTVRGTRGDDTLSGLAGADILVGGAGSDYLLGGAGGDVLTGGSGRDTFVVTSLADSYANDARGTDDSDTLTDFRTDSDVLDLSALRFTGLGTGHNGTLLATAVGTDGDLLLESLDADLNGNYFKVLLEGLPEFDSKAIRFGVPEATNFDTRPAPRDHYFTPAPTDGDDSFTGSYSDDRLDGLAGNDTLIGGPGDDTLDGGDGADNLSGGGGNDRLAGGSDNDALAGGSGDDLLQGGAGTDNLTGGSGGDTFRFSAITDSLHGANDRITDFDPSRDLIDLSALGYTGMGDGHDTTVKVSYTPTTGRAYIQNLDANEAGARFEIVLSNLAQTPGSDRFVFAASGDELALLGIAAA